MKTLDCDYLVIGAGLAGLSAAMGGSVWARYFVFKLTLQSNSSRAQGGIAVPVAEGDTIEAHLQDTTVAGARLTNAEVAADHCRRSPHCRVGTLGRALNATRHARERMPIDLGRGAATPCAGFSTAAT